MAKHLFCGVIFFFPRAKIDKSLPLGLEPSSAKIVGITFTFENESYRKLYMQQRNIVLLLLSFSCFFMENAMHEHIYMLKRRIPCNGSLCNFFMPTTQFADNVFYVKTAYCYNVIQLVGLTLMHVYN